MFDARHRQIIVIAHRGCHEAAPAHHLGPAPENSLLALEHCVSMDVDMMETDVRRTADGHLVIMHDDEVSRTTEGNGNIADLTLEEILKLHLRQNLGGYAEPLSDERVPTLEQVLSSAKGRIALNLDVKGPIYAEVVDAVLRAGAATNVTIKAPAGIASPRLASTPPYSEVPFIPIIDPRGSTSSAVALRQLTESSPLALELPRMQADELSSIADLARERGRKVTVNTLGEGYLVGRPGDNSVSLGCDAIWGWAFRHGASAFQTDKVEALVQFRNKSSAGGSDQ